MMVTLYFMLGLGCSVKEPTAIKSTSQPTNEKNQKTEAFSIQAKLPTVQNAAGYKLENSSSVIIVEATMDGIFVNGTKSIALENGLVPENEKDGLTISTLYKTVNKQIEETKSSFSAVLAIDENVSNTTLQMVMFSLGQAKVSEFYLLASDSKVTEMNPKKKSSGYQILVSDLGNNMVSVKPRFYNDENNSSLITTEQKNLSKTVRDLEGGCAIAALNTESLYGSTMAINDALYESGVQDISFGINPSIPKTPPVKTSSPSSKTTYFYGDVLPVFPIVLPAISNSRKDCPDTGKVRCIDTFNCLFMTTQGKPPESAFDGLNTLNKAKDNGKVSGKVAPENTQLKDGDSSCKQGVQKTLKIKRKSIQYCYEKQLKEAPTLQGRITLSFTIGQDGKTSAFSLENATKNDSLEKCIQRMVTLWKFPKDCPISVVYPVVLSTK